MIEHKYILEPYKGVNTRYRCPRCQKREKTFSLYIDTETGEHVHPTVGRCNREINCGHHYVPKQYFQDNIISFDIPWPKANRLRPAKPLKKPVSFIPFEVFSASLKAHEKNNFVQFLINLFGIEVASQLVSRYFIATSKHWNGATVFWQIDTKGQVRTGKIMLYNPNTGRRVKKPFSHISWAHSTLKQSEFELEQCFFGEHLLVDKTKPVAIVESEKTAIIASVYLPQFIWVAAGSITNLNAKKCHVLKGRIVTLFPDLNGFDNWNSKAKELSHLAIFLVSDLLERKATDEERKHGYDLADYLVKFNSKDFNLPEPEDIEPCPSDKSFIEFETKAHPETVDFVTSQEEQKSDRWEQDINELEKFFSVGIFPNHPIELDKCTTIQNPSLFVESHLSIIKANRENSNYIIYLDRLINFKKYIESST